MRYGSVCSGVEAATLAWESLGWKAQFFSEIEAFPSAVLKHHWPDVPNEGDFTKIGTKYAGKIDLLVGGTPCQSFSVAGKREGLAGASGLALDYIKLAYESGVRWIVWENVPGCFSSNRGRDFSAFLSGLAGFEVKVPAKGWRNAGFVRNVRRDRFGLAWRVLDAQYVRVDGFGRAVPQRRRRVFVIGYFGDWRRAAAVLFEHKGVLGDHAPRRIKGAGVARSLTASTGGASGKEQHRRNILCMATQQGGAEITENYCPTITEAAGTSGNNQPIVCMATGQGNAETGENCAVNLTCNHESPLICAGFCQGASPAAGMAVLCAASCQANAEIKENVAPTIVESSDTGWPYVVLPGHTVFGICAGFMGGQGSKAGGIAYEEQSSPTIKASPSGGNQVPDVICVHGSQDPITNTDHANAVNRNNGLENCVCQYGDIAGTLEARHDSSPCADRGMNVVCVSESGQGYWMEKETAGTLRAEGENRPTRPSNVVCYDMRGNGNGKVSPTISGDHPGRATDYTPCITINSVVRRLLPIECERLMGFPDNHTRIPWRGKPEEDCPDSPRYKACGNSMCVNVMRWVGMRIELVERKGTLC